MRRFERAYDTVKAKDGIIIPEYVKSSNVLTRAEVEDEDNRTRLPTRLNHDDPDTVYKQMKTQILEMMNYDKEDGGTIVRQVHSRIGGDT